MARDVAAAPPRDVAARVTVAVDGRVLVSAALAPSLAGPLREIVDGALAEDMGASVSARSELGRGSTFALRLKRDPVAPVRTGRLDSTMEAEE